MSERKKNRAGKKHHDSDGTDPDTSLTLPPVSVISAVYLARLPIHAHKQSKAHEIS